MLHSRRACNCQTSGSAPFFFWWRTIAASDVGMFEKFSRSVCARGKCFHVFVSLGVLFRARV